MVPMARRGPKGSFEFREYFFVIINVIPIMEPISDPMNSV